MRLSSRGFFLKENESFIGKYVQDFDEEASGAGNRTSPPLLLE